MLFDVLLRLGRLLDHRENLEFKIVNIKKTVLTVQAQLNFSLNFKLNVYYVIIVNVIM